MKIVAVTTLAAVLVVTGCAPSPDTTVTIGAASSLTKSFTEIGEEFMRANPGIQVRFSFAGSSAIAEQIRGGAPIDGFASAGVSAMRPVAQEGLVTDVRDFARNSLEIVVPANNPAGIGSLPDLAGSTFVACQPQVPCGVAYQALVSKNDLTLTPASLEPDASSVLAKVETDEADAGIVYVTDILGAGDSVTGVEIPAVDNVTSTYQIGVVTASRRAVATGDFIDFVMSPAGQRILAANGFESR